MENPYAEYPSIRRDPVTGDRVVFAPKRNQRPHAKAAPGAKPVDRFSAAHLKQEPVLAEFGRGAERVLAIGNAFPVFGPQSPLGGHQEILVEGQANRKFSSFSVGQMAKTLDAVAGRVGDLRRNKRCYKYIVAFKNEGHEAGASQKHAHSQIFALPFVPDRLRRMYANRRKLAAKVKVSVHALVLSEATPGRIIWKDGRVVAFGDPFTPFAYGVRIVPRRNFDNIAQATPAERRSLARALYALMPLVRKNGWAFNFHSHDVIADRHEPFDIRFFPRVNIPAGFEFDAGVYINPVSPEQAAEEYRRAGA
jgi:UDPglucose--hexose-1-phosphate uridylyltransferase